LYPKRVNQALALHMGASKSGGDVLPFVNYAVTGFLDQLRDQLDVVWAQQWDVAWRNYVHEAFKDQESRADIRRRRLALDLSLKEDPVPLSKLPEISVRLAAAYAKKTKKTLTRDVATLMKMNLLKRQKTGYVANKELILGFLPARASEGCSGLRSVLSPSSPILIFTKHASTPHESAFSRVKRRNDTTTSGSPSVSRENERRILMERN
jgi:hypothetical protein